MQMCEPQQTEIIEAKFLQARLKFQSPPSSTCSLDFQSVTTMPTDHRCWVSSLLSGLISKFPSRLRLRISAWFWFAVLTWSFSPSKPLQPSSHNSRLTPGSTLQRSLLAYSSQQHEITLWQIQLAWQRTTSLSLPLSVLNHIAYKCCKLNPAAHWNVASRL